MELLFRISPDNLVATYARLKTLFRGHDRIIFDSMQAVVVANDLPNFVAPTSPSEFEQKHKEIESKLRKGRIRGRETAILLMEEILRCVQEQGGIRGISTEDILDKLYIDTSETSVRIRLRENRHWVAEWSVRLDHKRAQQNSTIEIYIHSTLEGEITPMYIVEYVNSAIYNYSKGMYTTSVALLTIAVEATLRDVLTNYDYSYNPRATSVDIYSYTSATIEVLENGYLITYDEPMPKSTSDFLVSTGGQTRLKVSVRRLIKPRTGKDRIDLYMRIPECLVDHLSSNTLAQHAERSVSGLGAALRIVRNQENLVTPEDLPLDFEEVLTVVRNNLIHLSGEALETPLLMMKSSGDFKLRDFLDDGEIVFDFITSIPEFINSQYRKLRQIQRSKNTAT